ncbi:MAG: glycosyltransferase family 39 protein, partial [Chloroflexi bacterium]|nr:glycosyltransferase family 39 protein [Chloroflexota bacterium]
MTHLLKKRPIPWPTVWFAIIVLTYLALGGLYALYTPPWQAPDEPAHFNYIRYVAEEGRLPELVMGDYPVEYLEEIKAHRFAEGWSVDPLRYEAHQPPLYYLGGALVYRLAKPWGMPNLLYALRLFSVLIGAAGLGVGYGVARRLAPNRPALALGAVAFAATLPMHIAMTSAVNNDGLAELMVGLVAWAIAGLKWEAWTVRRAVGIGALLGLAFLTKMQSN